MSLHMSLRAGKAFLNDCLKFVVRPSHTLCHCIFCPVLAVFLHELALILVNRSQ